MTTLTIHHGAPKPIRVRGKNVCALVSFAEKYPGWHSLGMTRADKRALESAVRAGCIEVNEHDQFRFIYPAVKPYHSGPVPVYAPGDMKAEPFYSTPYCQLLFRNFMLLFYFRPVPWSSCQEWYVHDDFGNLTSADTGKARVYTRGWGV